MTKEELVEALRPLAGDLSASQLLRVALRLHVGRFGPILTMWVFRQLFPEIPFGTLKAAAGYVTDDDILDDEMFDRILSREDGAP